MFTPEVNVSPQSWSVKIGSVHGWQNKFLFITSLYQYIYIYGIVV